MQGSAKTLKRDTLNVYDVIFQGVAGSAPAGAAVATLTGSAAFALGSLPLSAVVAFVILIYLNVYYDRL